MFLTYNNELNWHPYNIKEGLFKIVILIQFTWIMLLDILTLSSITLHVTSAPLDSGVFMPGVFGGSLVDSELAFIHKDDKNNIYFDLYAVKGEEDRIMYAKNGVLVVSIGPNEDIHSTIENHLWKFIATILQVNTTDIEILMFPGEIGRRVLIRNKIMSEQECQNKIKEYLQPYIPLPAHPPGEVLLHPYTPLAVFAQNDTGGANEGVWKYYEMDVPGKIAKELRSEKKSEKLLRKKLLEMKPFYEKDPSLMAAIFRDLGNQREAVFRGRLVPGSPVKPVLDDYRGQGKVKLVRRILKGVEDGSRNKKPKSKTRLEMSHPLPDLIMLDYLSPDKKHVVSRRLMIPLYRNDTTDIVEELEYTEAF